MAAAIVALLAVVGSGLGQERAERAPRLTWEGVRTTAVVADSGFGFVPRHGVVARRTAFVAPGWEWRPVPEALALEPWVELQRDRRERRLWESEVGERLAGRSADEEGLIPELEKPLRIPEPLARVFGEGSNFDVQGKLHMGALGSRSTQDPDLRSQLLQRTVGAFDLDLDQTLDLRIVGTVGTKLDVAVDFNSQRELESRQRITATYTGTEDEILRQVEVGDIQVALPVSRFLGSAARGTFGGQAVGQLGPVDLRVLGSRKEGNTTDRTLSIAPSGEGVLSEVTLDIKDTQFQNDRFFLLFHPDSLAPGPISYPSPGTALAIPGSTPEATTLNLWLDDGNFSNNRELNSKPGTALVDPNDPDVFPEQAFNGFFDLLVEGEDYVVTDGIIVQLKRQLNDTEVLAAAYVTRDGTAVGTPQDAPEQTLKLIKPINPDTTDFTWDYTLRNIYSLREPNIQLGSLELTIYRGARDLKQTFETIDGESRKYSQIFGATDPQSRIRVPRILRDPFGGSDYLVLPNVRPFFEPTDPTGALIPIEVPNRRLYFNSDPNRTALDDQIYFIEARYLSRGGLAGEIELGASNVIEGSERITIGSETLVRGTDYQILYDLGRIVLTDPAGLAERYPNDRLDISFEVAPLLNLAPTSLYGASGTYTMSEAVSFNSTFLVQDQESLSNRPILGAEPVRTVIGTVDGTFARSAPFLTRWLDGLPGVDPGESSSFALRGEVAWSLPDPNTDGQVFLNDFENIEIAKVISPFFRSWRFAALPTESGLSLIDVADARWFTFAIDRANVTGATGGVDIGENNFVVRLDPFGATPEDRRRSWRSIQTILSATGEDVTRQEFIEFFLRGNQGRLIVDLGVVDEDAVRLDPNRAPVGLGQLDTEETNPDTRDNNLDVGEDVGLDGVEGVDGLGVPGDIGNDDFDDGFAADAFPANPNGTEENDVLDTEDDNLNGLLDRQERIVRWDVDLSGDRYEVPGSRNPRTGFRMIRLPLTQADQEIGGPDLRNVRVLRLTFSGVERTTDFEIVDLEIVGSTFLKRGIVDADGVPIAGDETDSLQIAAINDLENPEYESPPGVVAEQDRADEIAGVSGFVREQSLELAYRDLPDGARGSIFRPLFDRETYIDYERMRVWVQGRDVEGAGQPDFFVAFGLDTLNVYEYRAPLADLDWEEHVIEFAVFTELKRALLDSLSRADADTGSMIAEDGRYLVRIASATTPPPTITEVSQLTIGVENTTGAPVSGRFWIDEWRLTAPVREGGMATYVSARTKLADFGRVDVSYEGRGGRYRNLNAARNNFDFGDFDLSAQFQLEKLLPSSWGVAVPLTYDRVNTSSTPLFLVGSDIRVTDSAGRDSIQRTNSTELLTLRAFRTRRSSNPLVAATLDQLEARVIWRGEELGSVDLDTDRGRWETYLGYRTGFRPRGLPLGLGWIAKLPWPEVMKDSDALRRLATADLNLAPATLALSATTTFEERNRTKVFADGTDFTADTTRNLGSNAAIEFQPVGSMRASFGWNSTRDLIFPETVVERGMWGIETLEARSFDFNWTPPVATWLRPRYSYSSAYNRNHTREASRSLDSLDLRDYGVTTNENLSLEFGLADLVRALDGGPGTGGAVGVGRQVGWWARLFGPIRFDRRHRESVQFVQEEEDPGFGFGFGFGDIESVAGEEPQVFAENDDWSLSAVLTPLAGLQVRGGYQDTDTFRRYLTGTNERSIRIWPDVELRWGNVRMPAFLRGIVPAATLASAYERRTSDESANAALLSERDQRLWDPVFSFRLTWANGMSTDLRAVTSETVTRTVRGGALDNRRTEASTDWIFNLDYSVQPGTKLWIPFPTLWGVTLKQPLLTALTFSRRARDDETQTFEGDGVPVVNLKTQTTEIRPSVAYEFGRVVSGFAVSYLSRRDKKRGIVNKTYGLEAFLDFLF